MMGMEDAAKKLNEQDDALKAEKAIMEMGILLAKSQMDIKTLAAKKEAERREIQKEFNAEYVKALELQAKELDEQGKFVEAAELRIKAGKIQASEEAKGFQSRKARGQFWHNKQLEWDSILAEAKKKSTDDVDKKKSDAAKKRLDELKKQAEMAAEIRALIVCRFHQALHGPKQ